MSKLLPSNARLAQLLQEYKVELNKEVNETVVDVDRLIERLAGNRKIGAA